MPVQHLGQLKPSMQEQIALQRALLALQREDEEIRMKTMPQTTQPTLARGLGTSPDEAEPAFREGMEYSPITREPLARALGTPITGRPDWQAEAWATREEMIEERKSKAKGLYDRLLPLDEEGRKIVLEAAPREIINAMEQEGYISKDGRLAEPKEEATSVQYVTSDNGEMIALTTYPDGRIETEHTGVYPMQEAKEAEGASPSDLIAMQRLGLDMAKYNSSLMVKAFELSGDVPREGLDMVTDADGNERAATAQDEAIGLNRVMQIYNTLVATGAVREVATEGEATMSDVEREFNASSAEGKMAMQAKLGVPQTGDWDEATAFAMETYGEILLGEKEPVKKPEKESNIKTGGGLSGL